MNSTAKWLVSTAIVAAAAAGGTAGCSSQSDTASRNLSTAAEEFELQRAIVATNGRTGEVTLFVEGRCSLETANSFLEGAIEIVCKVGEDTYTKDFYLPGDADQMAIKQLEPIEVDTYRTKWIVRPATAVPIVDIDLGWGPSD